MRSRRIDIEIDTVTPDFREDHSFSQKYRKTRGRHRLVVEYIQHTTDTITNIYKHVGSKKEDRNNIRKY